MENYIVSKAQLTEIAKITRYKAMLDNSMLVNEIPAYIAGIAGGGTSYVLNGLFGFNTELMIYNKSEGTEDEIINQNISIFGFPIDIVNRNDILIGDFIVIDM